MKSSTTTLPLVSLQSHLIQGWIGLASLAKKRGQIVIGATWREFSQSGSSGHI